MSGSKIESGLQLFSRLSQRPAIQNLNPVLFGETAPYPNDLIEITGGSGTGKTLLVMDLLVRCVLPREYKGKGCGAIIINTDHHFDLFRFIEMMECFIQKCSNIRISQSAVEEVVKNALSNLIVLNCYSFQQLQVTFLNLEKVLHDNENVALITIDGISSYYWEYRNVNSTIISLQNYHAKLLENLQDQIKDSNLVTVFTRNDVELTLDTCWKITLKQHENKFQALLRNSKKNINKTVYYTIEKTVKFVY